MVEQAAYREGGKEKVNQRSSREVRRRQEQLQHRQSKEEEAKSQEVEKSRRHGSARNNNPSHEIWNSMKRR